MYATLVEQRWQQCGTMKIDRTHISTAPLAHATTLAIVWPPNLATSLPGPFYVQTLPVRCRGATNRSERVLYPVDFEPKYSVAWHSTLWPPLGPFPTQPQF